MKALVVLLLVLNIGFGAWQWSRPAPAVPAASVDPGVESLRLLSEVEGAGAAAVHMSSPQPSPAPVPTRTASPTPPSAPPMATASPTPAPIVLQCYSLGPFASSAQAMSLRQRLQAAGLGVQVRTDPAQADIAYRVVLPPLASRDSALQVARQLAADGITDYRVMTDERQRNVISLGVFKDRPAASRRQARVAALGYAPHVETHEMTAQTFWLEVREESAGNDVTALLNSVHTANPLVRREPRPCP